MKRKTLPKREQKYPMTPPQKKIRTLISLRHTHHRIFTWKRKPLKNHGNRHDQTKWVTKREECAHMKQWNALLK